MRFGYDKIRCNLHENKNTCVQRIIYLLNIYIHTLKSLQVLSEITYVSGFINNKQVKLINRKQIKH